MQVRKPHRCHQRLVRQRHRSRWSWCHLIPRRAFLPSNVWRWALFILRIIGFICTESAPWNSHSQWSLIASAAPRQAPNRYEKAQTVIRLTATCLTTRRYPRTRTPVGARPQDLRKAGCPCLRSGLAGCPAWMNFPTSQSLAPGRSSFVVPSPACQSPVFGVPK
jgi:hypothetical protein